MRKSAFTFCIAVFALVLAGCGGGGGGANAPLPSTSNSGGGTQAVSSLATEDLFQLEGSDLLAMLENDAGFSVTSTAPAPAKLPDVARRDVTGPFVAQIAGGTATIARSGSSYINGVGFIMTYRDASGLCECSNDIPSLPPAYKTVITNPLWHASGFKTAASTTTLGIAMKNNVDSSDKGGTYTATVSNPPGGSATFSVTNNLVKMPRQGAPSVAVSGSSLVVTWPAVAGGKDYFLTFLTRLNNDPRNKCCNVVGFVLTDKTSVTIPLSQFYSHAMYQAMVISSDVNYIDVYLSQGVQQKPTLPSQIDLSASQLLVFHTP